MMFLNSPKALGGAGLNKIIPGTTIEKQNVEIGEITGGVEVIGEGLKQFEQRFMSNQRFGFKHWLFSNIEILNRDDFQFKPDKVFKNNITLDPKPFLIAKNIEIYKPKYKDGWDSSVIISENQKVMEQAFTDFEDWVKGYSGKRKFVYKWLSGKLKISNPSIEHISDDFMNTLLMPYHNSIIYAMLKKNNMNRHDPWFSLNLYFEQNAASLVLDKYKAFFIGS